MTFLILLLVATVLYYLSRQAPLQLKDKARTRAVELRKLQDLKSEDWAIERTLMAYMVEDEQQSFFVEIAKHVSLALFVSCILIIAVEVHARRVERRELRRYLQQVTENVFAGVSQRLLGTKTTTELTSILRQDFAKDKCGYQITFQPPPDGNPPDRVVALFETWYSVRNLSNSPAEFPFEVNLIGQEKGEIILHEEKVELPDFITVKIAGKEVPPDELKDAKKSLRIEKRIFLSDDSEARVDVYVAARLLYRTRSTEIMYSDTVMEGSSVVVINEAPNLIGRCEASVLHPAFKEVSNPARGRWEFQRPLLPGQGWYVNWEPPDSKGQMALFDRRQPGTTS